jgi:allantoinase
MSDFDLLVRSGTVVTSQGTCEADLGVSGETISALAPNLPGTGKAVIDAHGLHIFPGVIDAHVHFNEPGRAHWEGFETGSRALAAGGGTLFFDMPLNAHPPTLDADSFRLKLAAAERSSLVDFAFWGGLVPQNLDRLAELADCGVVGFKAFMSDSGIEAFPRADDCTLREGMKRASKLRLPVAVHAESETMTHELAQERIAQGLTSIRDYLASRPVEAELEAIRRAIDLAGETGCALHVVHVSSGSGVRLIAEARRAGANVSCETCPHYLVLTQDDLEQLGAIAKCAPPLRPSAEQQQLWQHLIAGDITTVGSDHSPSPPEMKSGSNFFQVWGGISGAQHTLPLLLTEAHVNRNVALALVASLLSDRVAERFRLPATKGRLAVGADADFALVNLGQAFEVKKQDLRYRHAHSPYVGRVLRGKVVRTVLRGRTVFKDGAIAAASAGCLVRPVLVPDKSV